jgi:hypothetical protein
MSSAPLIKPTPAETVESRQNPNDPAAYDLPPELAHTALRGHDGPILIDLDETLYLRNSTEDYIDSARPRLLALVLLRLFDVLKPWRLTGGEATRDVWRVRLIRLFFPWTSLIWKARVARLARDYGNRELLVELQRLAAPKTIVTVGFRPVVAPLIAALGFANHPLVACELTPESRRRGKLEMARDALGEESVRRALLLTDSLADLPLLQRCARGIRTVWPGATYRRAFADVYFPGQYIAHIKHPGEHYLRRAVLQDDFMWWVLSSIALTGAPIAHVAGLFLLLVSFWIIYETGYADNDTIAHRFEAQPALTSAFHEVSVATPKIQPWFWSLACAVAGICVIHRTLTPPLRDLGGWTLALAATASWFALYNRANKSTRVWMYGGLQFARTAIFTLIVPILPIGGMALAAQILTRWAQYFIYRLMGKNWPMQSQFGVARLGTFVLLAAVLAISLGWRVLFNWTTLALVGWSLYRARRELATIFSSSVKLERR